MIYNPASLYGSMGINSYGKLGLAALTLAGNLFFNGCSHCQLPELSSSTKLQQLEHRIILEKAIKNNERDKYAVLISGTNATRDVYDLSEVYQILLENGFKRENTYILDGLGQKTALYPVAGISSRAEIEALFEHLANKVDPLDLLLVYLTGHGRRDTIPLENQEKNNRIEISELRLSNSRLNEIELKEILDKINSKTTIVLVDICYGGGFANRFSNKHYAGISSSLETEVAYGNTNEMFSRYFLEAYRNTTESDLNKNGSVSLKEAFEYARQNHSWSRDGQNTPLLKSELD